jgi:two-component system, NarL family, nitrate/nitrite response regulator NarL
MGQACTFNPIGNTADPQRREAVPHIRVLMADTNSLNSSLLIRELQSNSPLQVESCSGEVVECLETLANFSADVLLWAASTRSTPNAIFEAVPELRSEFPALRIVLILDCTSKDHVINAFRAGAHGVFSREEGSVKLLRKCISSVYAGQVWISNTQSLFLVDAIKQSREIRVLDAKGAELLTPRQMETVELIVEGLGNQEIALRLGVSLNTVKKSIYRIFDKLGVSNRVELVRYALASEPR